LGNTSLSEKLKIYVKESVANKMLQDFPFLSSKDIKISIDDSYQKTIPATACSFRLHFSSNAKFLGKTVLPIKYFDAQNNYLARNYLTFMANAFTNFVYTTATLKKGQRIQASDLTLKYQTILGKPSQCLKKLSAALGQQTRHNIAASSYLTTWMIEEVPDIRKGDKIAIVIKKRHLQLKVKGQALENGTCGQTIKIKSLMNNKKILEGEIIDSKNVQVTLIN
jgi:flagella basal body P-ring formation protein FlgA